MEQQIILSIAYFPNLQYFSKILNSEKVLIEQYENFSKQSYRNRCEILSANGKQALTFPIIKKSGSKQLIKDAKIDYTTNWQDIHFKSLKTAYLSSPFYEFYIDAITPFFEKKYKFLFDFNMSLIKTLLNEIQININIELSDEYITSYKFSDHRNSIHPKEKFQKEDKQFSLVKYTQVFSQKYGFVPNLSILDLLFNEGPNTNNLLRQMIKV